MPRASWLLAGLAVLCLGGPRASADALQSSYAQPLVEVSHTVDITLADGVATYRVRRVFANPGGVADEAGLEIDLPAGAAATGLRIRAHDRWYDADLMERDAAEALYREFAGFGTYQPKAPALLQWMWTDKLYLQVFPVMPNGASTVEYTLTVPTRYAGGRYWLSYPRVDTAQLGADSPVLATPVVTVHTAWSASQPAIAIDGRRALLDTPVVLAPAAVAGWLAAIDTDSDASYVASALDVPDSSYTRGTFATAKVTLDVAHTYIGDLRVELLTPAQEHVVIQDRSGGATHDLRGTFDVALPPETTGAGTWRLVASDHAALDTGSIDGWSLQLGDTAIAATDTPVAIPDAPDTPSDVAGAAVAVDAPPTQPMWAIRFGRVIASDVHAFSRLEIDAARELVAPPKRAQVVFVIDASYSVGDAGLAAQLAIARTYLAQLPDAAVELIAYRRHAERVFGRFVAARDLDRALADAVARGALALGNGSSLDDGARLATAVIAARPGPRRVVMLTDELVRNGLAPAAAEAALAGLPTDAVVHVVVPELDGDDGVTLVRDDTAAFAALATGHHGIYAELRGAPTEPNKQLAPVVLELVRPSHIEHLAVAGVPDGPDAPQLPDTLHAGDGVRTMWLARTAPSHLVVTGVLWSDPIRADVTPSAAFSRQTAAFVFGAGAQAQLSNDEMLRVAFAGGAVSPVTSYVAAAPRTRPPTSGSSGFAIMSACGGTVGWPTLTSGRARTARGDLRALVDANACLHDQPAADVELDVETTRDEVVDVSVVGAQGPLAACLAEAVWRTRLDGRFTADRDHYTVAWSR